MPGTVLHTLVILTHLSHTTTIRTGGIITTTLPVRELTGTEKTVGFLEAGNQVNGRVRMKLSLSDSWPSCC